MKTWMIVIVVSVSVYFLWRKYGANVTTAISNATK